MNPDQHFGPGKLMDLKEPSPDGVDLMYSDEYVARSMGAYNPYGYCWNNPVNYVDPDGRWPVSTFPGVAGFVVKQAMQRSDSFFVCWREIRAVEKGERTAAACNCMHTDVYSELEGQIREGFLGGIPQGMGGNFPPPGYTCVKLRRYVESGIFEFIYLRQQPQANTLGYGIGKNTTCDKATNAQIVDCIRKYPRPSGSSRLLSNCQTDSENAITACCLTGFKSKNTNVADILTSPKGGTGF